MSVHALATGLAANRILFGIGYLVAPERAGRGWIGSAAEDEATKVFTRALGARDLALGLGALSALTGDQRDVARRWMAAHAVADTTDLIATLAARDRLPRTGFLFALGMAGASAAVALAGALALEPDSN